MLLWGISAYLRVTIYIVWCPFLRRNIVIMVWQRCVGFEHNQGLGGTEVNLDKVSIGQPISGWYPLFPMHSYGGSDSDNSP